MPRIASTDTKNADARPNAKASSAPNGLHAPPSVGAGNQAMLRLQRKCGCGGAPDCDCSSGEKKEGEGGLHRKAASAGATLQTAPPIVHDALRSPGAMLDPVTRAFFESRFREDFSGVRIHTDSQAGASARAVNAAAYTVGPDIAFAPGSFAPDTVAGRRLLAHELSHTLQQPLQPGGAASSAQTKLSVSAPDDQYEREADQVADEAMRGLDPPRQQTRDRRWKSVLSSPARLQVQRTLGDGHDLTSPRFSRMLDLEAAFDDETVIKEGSPASRGVQAIQQALYDLGFTLPTSGADGNFGSETAAAVTAFQSANPPLAVDGEVGQNTMTALNARFGPPVLPTPAARSAAWTPACVRSVICQWSPHTIEVLRTRITLKSFDSISWADEQWDGASWVPAPFPGGGYNTGTEIGVLNSSCEEMSETLYHEVLHAEQPTRQRTTLERESYAYRIGEEFSIAMGLGGRPSLRSTDAQGRQFADPAKVGAFVATEYPSVPAGGGGDEIIAKAAAVGQVVVQRPNGTTYTRAASVGEKVPGPRSTTNEVLHPRAAWTCP
jgi:hypothetical protein